MDEKNTKFLKLKNDGKSLRQIAKQAGISHVAVKKRLDRLIANETCNQAPPQDTGQLWDMDEYPELNHAVTEIDGLLMDIEQLFSNHQETPESITIETPNGWKMLKKLEFLTCPNVLTCNMTEAATWLQQCLLTNRLKHLLIVN